MKTPIALMSIGLLGSALTAAGIAGYLAWNSLTGEAELTPIAQTEPAPTAASAPIAQPVTAISSPVAAQSTPSGSITWSKPENDYLFDLSQALQPAERERLSPAEQINIARKIQSWLEAGANYWKVREQFDAAYRESIVGDYAHNRDVYIKFATQRFAPNYVATLMQPSVRAESPVQRPFEAYPESRFEAPPEYFEPPSYAPPHDAPYEAPFGVPFEEPFEGPFEEGFEGPMAGPIPQPMPYPYPNPHYPPPHAYPRPQPQPIPYPDRPDRTPYPFPNQNPHQNPYPPTNPRPTNPQPSSPDIPGVTEISAQAEPSMSFSEPSAVEHVWQGQQ